MGDKHHAHSRNAESSVPVTPSHFKERNPHVPPYAWAISAALAALIAIPAYAQQPACAPQSQVANALSGERWGEEVIDSRIDQHGNLVEFWANAQTGTWSITVTRPADGLSCIIQVGRGYWPPDDPA